MSSIGDRHAGDLSGRLSSPGFGSNVSIRVAGEFAGYRSTKHLVWMLLNLLARQPGEIQGIELHYPSDIPAGPDISPLFLPGADFAAAALRAIDRINPGVVGTDADAASRIIVRIGLGAIEPSEFSIAVSADHWSGYVGSEPATVLTDSSNPIGAYVGASLGAGEIFKFVRKVRDDEAETPWSLWLNAHTLEVGSVLTESPALPAITVLPPTTLAGVGAVGNGFLQTLYSLPGVCGSITAVDGDPDGVTETNLNRYVMFDRTHVESLHMKASTVAEMFLGKSLRIVPFDEDWQAAVSLPQFVLGDVVISAVDRNGARHAIQDAMPGKIIGGATNELRLQVNLYEVFDPESVCLKCRNKVEIEGLPDDLIVEHLQNLSPDDLERAANKMCVELDGLIEFLADPKTNCGKIKGESLQKFAASGDTDFSVGFVSFLAGILLCAEYLKQVTSAEPRMSLSRNQYRFQFWRPGHSKANRMTTVPPEEGCMCRSEIYQYAIGIERGKRVQG